MFYTPGFGFTREAVDATSVAISEARWLELLRGQNVGARIVADGQGRPVLDVPPGVTLPEGVTP